MFSTLGENMKRLRLAVPLLALSFVACELDVADPGVVAEDELAGPSSVPTTINGVIGDLATATEHYALYASLFTDEMILAGTFPTRVQVDERRVVPANSSVTDEVEENLQVARNQARKMVENFTGFQGDDEFNQQALLEGIAIGHYVRGLMQLQLGEIYCEIPIEGGGSPVPSDQVVSAALSTFQQAETAAADAGLTDWQNAAILGQARAELYLGNVGQAATLASNVPSDHRLFVEFSTNDPEQFNKVFDLTFGSQNEVIRWTVGDGTQGERLNEMFAEYDEFVAAGMIDPCDTEACADEFEAFNSSIAVQLQEVYNEASDDILVSTGMYADLIEAEDAIRNGTAGCDQTITLDCSGTGEGMINTVRDSWDERWTAERFRVDTTLPPIDDRANAEFGGDFEDITQEQQLYLLAGEIARETWLTGVRQETARRFVQDQQFGGAGTLLDLYPDKGAGNDQVCFPVSEQEDTGASP